MSLADDVFKRIIGILAAAAANGAVKMAPDLISKLRDWWNGKCIAVIGPTASGKNSLFNKLKNENAPSDHIATRGAEDIGTFNFSWPMPDGSKIGFRCKNSINVGGEEDERDRYWLQSCSDADVIFYLIDLEKILKNPDSTTDRIKADIMWIAENFPKLKSGSNIHFLLNKIDVLTGDCDANEIKDSIFNGTKDHLNEIENIAKNILGPNFDRLSGISPISMTDPYLFSTYFTFAMQSVSRAMEK